MEFCNTCNNLQYVRDGALVCDACNRRDPLPTDRPLVVRKFHQETAVAVVSPYTAQDRTLPEVVAECPTCARVVKARAVLVDPKALSFVFVSAECEHQWQQQRTG
jgi:DNA-directed RNA polymerase subunit M/transcription elongation factor TFIIS